MKKSLSRVVSFFTAFLILFVGSAFHAAADNSLNTEELVILPISDIPEVISYEDAIDRGHVERLKSEETDMHSVIFRNSDGTKSLYMFASPVKYAASDGSVKDKRTDISITANGFGVTDNDVKLTFGNTSANATTVVNNGNTVKITPKGINSTVGMLQNNTMVYNGVFGNNTMLVYTPLLSGLKAGIILRSQGEINSFSFDLEAIGLTPAASTDGVINLNNTDSETIFEIGTYLVTDANGKYTEGEMILSGNAEDGYTVTANVDEAFLNAEDTAYPVIVEPNITLNTSSAIDDAVIYSEKPNKAYGAYKYNNIGYLDSYGIGRLLVKFPGLNGDNSTFSTLKVAQIRSAEYCMYAASSNTSTIDLMMYHLNHQEQPWAESSVTWSDFNYISLGNLLPLKGKWTNPIAATATSFDMTTIIKAWHEKPNFYDIIITNKNETSSYACADFCSTEYADSNNGNLMPYLTINYGTAQYAQVKLNIHIDDAFIRRACEIYPDCEEEEAYIRRIAVLFSDVVIEYRERFAIKLIIMPTINIIETCIDDCPQSNNIDGHCTCTDVLPDHHTNANSVLYDVPNGDPDKYLSVFLTGHYTCTFDNNTCSFGLGGLANPSLYKLAIYTSALPISENNNLIVSMNIAHEIGHLFGLTEDHYDENNITELGKNDNCIWGYNQQNNDVMSSFVMCYYCQNKIYENYDKYDHS